MNLKLDAHIYQYPLNPHMRMGEVERINGLKLGVAKGPDNSSVLTSKGQDVSLEKRTFLLLIPARGVFPHGPADVEVASASCVEGCRRRSSATGRCTTW